MRSKESGKVRYAYGVAMALLLGGTAFSLATGPAGAQVAQNAPAAMARAARRADVLRRSVARLQPAVVNISTKQRVPVRAQADPFEEFFRRFGNPASPAQGSGSGGGSGSSTAAHPRSGLARLGLHHFARRLHRHQQPFDPGPDRHRDGRQRHRHDDHRKEYTARIVGRDETSDLALLKIEGRNLPFVQWGDSTRARVGDWVLAIGNPYGLGGTVTAGIISALHRGITGVGAYDRYIQTDAAINMGNSRRPDVRPQRQCHRHQLGADLADRRIGRHRPRHPRRARQAGDRLADEGPAAAARLSRRRPPAARRESRAAPGPAQGQRRDRSLGRGRRAGGARRAPAGRRHRPRQRPAGDARPDRLLPRRQHAVGSRIPLDIIRGGRRQTIYGRRSASVRPRKSCAKLSGGGDAGHRHAARRWRRRRRSACRSDPDSGARARRKPAGDALAA